MVLRRRGKLACSFCGKDQDQVSQLIAGPAVHICGACVGLCNRIIAGESAAAFPEDGAVEAQLEALGAAAAAADSVSDLLHARVAGLREREVPWQQIAEALGVSRQAAWERFR